MAWLKSATRAQLNLQENVRINDMWLPGSSNVFLAEPNQISQVGPDVMTLPEALDAGVRFFRLSDVQPTGGTDNDFLMCPDVFDQLMRQCGDGQETTDCMAMEFPNRCPVKRSMRLQAFLVTVRSFMSLPENSEDVLVVWLDLKVKWSADLYTGFVKRIRSALGGMLLGQSDFAGMGHTFPTLQKARSMNKRVVVVEGTGGPGADTTELIDQTQFRHSAEDIVAPASSVDMSSCVRFGAVNPPPAPPPVTSALRQKLLVFGDTWHLDIAQNRIYDGPSMNGVLDISQVKALMACDYIALPDNVTRSDNDVYVWSWDSEEPKLPRGATGGGGAGEKARCAMLNFRGRWEARPCDEVHHVACQNTETHGWSITAGTSRWSSANVCPAGSMNGVPVSPGHNNALHKAFVALVEAGGAVDGVWLSLSNNDDVGRWTRSGVARLDYGPTDYQTTLVHNLFGSSLILYCIATLVGLGVVATAFVMVLYRRKLQAQIKYAKMASNDRQVELANMRNVSAGLDE